MQPDLKDVIAAQETGDEVGAVGGDTDIAFAGFPFPLGELSREAFLRVRAFAPRIGLQLEHGPAVHLEGRPFEIDVATVRAQAIDQQTVQ